MRVRRDRDLLDRAPMRSRSSSISARVIEQLLARELVRRGIVDREAVAQQRDVRLGLVARSRSRASTSLSPLCIHGLGRAAALLGREDVEPARDELHFGLLEHRARRVRQRGPTREAHRVAALVQVRDVVGAPREAVREIADLDRARPRLAGRELDRQPRLREQLVGHAHELEALRQARSSTAPRCRRRVCSTTPSPTATIVAAVARDAARRGIRARDRHRLADRVLEQRPRRQPIEVEVALGERPRRRP